jgi:hypothetical protein
VGGGKRRVEKRNEWKKRNEWQKRNERKKRNEWEKRNEWNKGRIKKGGVEKEIEWEIAEKRNE